MKNVLLPTDLTVHSLWPVHNIVRAARPQKLVIHVVHMLGLPNCIGELLSIRENKPYKSIPSDFTEACCLLRNKYSKTIEHIQLHFLYGNTARFMNNFISARKIDEAYMLTNYTYGRPLANSIDFTPLLSKCKVLLHNLPLHNEAHSEYQILSALLNGHEEFKTPPVTPSRSSIINYF